MGFIKKGSVEIMKHVMPVSEYNGKIQDFPQSLATSNNFAGPTGQLILVLAISFSSFRINKIVVCNCLFLFMLCVL